MDWRSGGQYGNINSQVMGSCIFRTGIFAYMGHLTCLSAYGCLAKFPSLTPLFSWIREQNTITSLVFLLRTKLSTNESLLSKFFLKTCFHVMAWEHSERIQVIAWLRRWRFALSSNSGALWFWSLHRSEQPFSGWIVYLLKNAILGLTETIYWIGATS